MNGMQTGFAGAMIALGLLAASPARATGISDDFEGYAPGTFPGAWQDVADVATTLPLPPPVSGTVVDTTDAFGNATRAFAPVDALASSSGIYQQVTVGNFYRLSVDIRVDQFADQPAASVTDWAMQMGFAELGDFALTPQVGIYASSLTESWRLYHATNGFDDLELGVPVALGTWYNVLLELDATTGITHSVITDILTGTTLVDRSDQLSDWIGSNFDTIALFDGELSSANTIANLAVIDNVNVRSTVAEPATGLLALAAVGIWGAVARRRPRSAGR